MTLYYVLEIAGSIIMGTGIGIQAARMWRRKHPFDSKHVPARCLQRGHKWQRIPDLPIQFCNRYGCQGARVAPFMFQSFPEELTRSLEQKLDEKNALSMDRQP